MPRRRTLRPILRGTPRGILRQIHHRIPRRRAPSQWWTRRSRRRSRPPRLEPQPKRPLARSQTRAPRLPPDSDPDSGAGSNTSTTNPTPSKESDKATDDTSGNTSANASDSAPDAKTPAANENVFPEDVSRRAAAVQAPSSAAGTPPAKPGSAPRRDNERSESFSRGHFPSGRESRPRLCTACASSSRGQFQPVLRCRQRLGFRPVGRRRARGEPWRLLIRPVPAKIPR